MKKIIQTNGAPAAVGPYSQGIVTESNKLVFTAGQIPLDPATGSMVEGDIQDQAKQALQNLKAVLEAAGSGLDKAIKVTVFLKDMNDFKAMNEVYATFFTENPPARSAFEVCRLPLDALIEIECVAFVE